MAKKALKLRLFCHSGTEGHCRNLPNLDQVQLERAKTINEF